MRISASKDDPGFTRNVYNIKVLFNGVEAKRTVTADEELGYIDVVKVDDEGRVVLKEGDEIDTERQYGEVKIVVPEGWIA